MRESRELYMSEANVTGEQMIKGERMLMSEHLLYTLYFFVRPSSRDSSILDWSESLQQF